MAWEGIAAICAILGVIGGALTVVFVFGQLVARLTALEGRVSEERDKNTKQHEEFYCTSKEVIGISSDLKNLIDRFSELRDEIRAALVEARKPA
jgi:hypothetical protein